MRRATYLQGQISFTSPVHPISRPFFFARILAFVLVTLPATTLWAESVVAEEESRQAEFQVVELERGLRRPWAIAFLPDESMLITLRGGELLHLDGDRQVSLSGLPDIAAAGQGGLLDVHPHPEYGQGDNRWIYFTYSSRESGGLGTRLARARLSGDSLTDLEELFSMNNNTRTDVHFGSSIAFDNENRIYFSIGDRGTRDRAQDTSDHAGSVIRLNDDGSIPRENPFVGREGRDEIFSYGNRNIQGMARHPRTGAIWSHEHGPQGGDEVNIIQGGVNYGWPEITYGKEYGSGADIGETEAPGMAQPLVHWTPSIAPSGMTFYDGDRFPEWEHDIFLGALAGTHLRRLELDDDSIADQEVLLDGTLGRIRDVTTGPDGYLYLITDADNGGLYRLEPVR